MSIEIQLSITKLIKKSMVNQFSDVVRQVDYHATAKSLDYPQIFETCAGTIQLNIDELNDSDFINFEDVDEDLIVTWILSNENVNEIEELSFIRFLLYQIKSKIQQLQEEEEVLKSWKVDKVLNISIDEIQNPVIPVTTNFPLIEPIVQQTTESVESESVEPESMVTILTEDPVVISEPSVEIN